MALERKNFDQVNPSLLNAIGEVEWGGEIMDCEDYRNTNNEPVGLTFVEEYDLMRSTDEHPCYYTIPTCPSCGEMPYNDNYCVFCGQRFVLPTEEEKEEIRKKNLEELIKNTEGVIYDREKEHFFCASCGADVEAENSTQLLYHADGIDFYSYIYKCNKCGSHITRKIKTGEMM